MSVTVLNPFTPSFGAVPEFFVGRSFVIQEMQKAFMNWNSSPSITSLIVGPRGSGKTALLSVIGDEARKQGWIVIDAIPMEDMLDDIYQKLQLEAFEVLDEKQKIKLEKISLGNIIDFSFTDTNTPSLNWNNRFSLILKELTEKDIGVLITIDEATLENKELTELVSVYQLLRRKNIKISLVLAGLPFNIDNLLSGKTISFLRRAVRYPIQTISDVDVASALKKTIEKNKKTITEDALALAVQEIRGFPYMLQLLGYSVYEEANGNKVINISHVTKGIDYAKEIFINGVLMSTYLDLSLRDRMFLFAMLHCPLPCTMKDIIKVTEKTSGYLSTYKTRLLKAGVIQELPGKRLMYAMPYFIEFLEKQTELDN